MPTSYLNGNSSNSSAAEWAARCNTVSLHQVGSIYSQGICYDTRRRRTQRGPKPIVKGGLDYQRQSAKEGRCTESDTHADCLDSGRDHQYANFASVASGGTGL